MEAKVKTIGSNQAGAKEKASLILTGLASILLMILAGCGLPTVPPEERMDPFAPAYYKAGYDKVWNAALDTLDELGFVITQMSKDDGYITTDKRERDNRREKVSMRIALEGESVAVRISSAAELLVHSSDPRYTRWTKAARSGSIVEEIKLGITRRLELR